MRLSHNVLGDKILCRICTDLQAKVRSRFFIFSFLFSAFGRSFARGFLCWRIPIGIPSAPDQFKRTGWHDLLGPLVTLGALDVRGTHGDQAFGYCVFRALKLIKRHIHPLEIDIKNIRQLTLYVTFFVANICIFFLMSSPGLIIHSASYGRMAGMKAIQSGQTFKSLCMYAQWFRSFCIETVSFSGFGGRSQSL